jgi:TRAP-type transport system periplasmic protein
MSPFRRHKFLAGAACATGAFAIVRAPARAAQFEYKSTLQLPPDHPMYVRQVQLWHDVAQQSGGRLVVRVFPNGQLGGQSAMISQLRLNAVQFVATIGSTYSDFIPASGIDGIGFLFKNEKAAWTAMTGPLGDYVRKEFEAKGLYIPKGALFDQGMRQITTSTKPIRTVNDLAGLKIRVAPGKIAIDLFQTLGASPVAVSGNESYSAMETHIIDAQETPYLSIYYQKYFEVQKYCSVTNHMWAGAFLVTNSEAWKALPADIQGIVERNAAKYTALERKDSFQLNITLADKLRRLGLIFNDADAQTMRVRLGPYYARRKAELSSTAWTLIEDNVGKLA